MGFKKDWYGPSWGSRCGLDGPTEFSWGPGQVPPGAEYAAPPDGGRYVGRSPSMVDPPRRARRSEARGNPGDVITQ